MIRKLLLTFAGLSLCLAQAQGGDWVRLFNGKDLTGWRASEGADTFQVRDGVIVSQGKPRGHLFYAGDINGGTFKNFELMVDVKTEPNSNGGIYFHTEYQEKGWPEKGFEVQVNNTFKDPRKTASLYGVKDVFQSPARDDEWFTLHIIVNGNQVTTRVNDKLVVEWMQPEGYQGLAPEPGKKGPMFPLRKLSSGTFALQGHDPKSVVYYKNVLVKVLP